MSEGDSNEHLLNDLRRVADELNESPTVDQYNTHGSYSSGKIRSRFGSWTDAKREAGLALNKSGSKNYASDEDLIADIQRVAEEVEESPTAEQYRERGEYSTEPIKLRFGSWNEAKQEAGLETYSNVKSIEYTDEELLEDFRTFAAECEGPVTQQKYRSSKGPNPQTLVKRFGSWDEVKNRVGLTSDPRKSYDSEQELLDDLQRVAEKIGEHPSQRQYRSHGEFSPSTLQQVFGGWNNAKEEAGLEVSPPDEYITPEELLDDLRRTASRLGKTPSKSQYNRWGEYSDTICQRRFGSWNNAVEAANLEPNVEIDIPKEEILNDIKAVASIVDRPPTVNDYREHGDHSLKPVYRHFDSWVGAVTAAGYDWTPYEYSDEELLKSLRDVADGKYAPRRSEYDKEWNHRNIHRRFGSWWAGCVQAGLLPRNRRPLSPRAIHEFHQAVLNLEPHYRTYALLFQFTGMPTHILQNLRPDWVADRQRRNIIRVPFEETRTGDPWLFEYPDTWLNPHTGEREPTQLPEALDWFITHYDEVPRSRGTFPQIIKRTAEQGDLRDYRRTTFHTNIGYVPDIVPDDLRITQGVNLAEQGIEPEVIARRLGIEESNWGTDVEDCYLWAYIHRDAELSNYNPPEIVFDPV